jgi:hypothetical protein
MIIKNNKIKIVIVFYKIIICFNFMFKYTCYFTNNNSDYATLAFYPRPPKGKQSCLSTN